MTNLKMEELQDELEELTEEELAAVAGGRCKQMPTEGGGICAVDTVCTT